MAPMIRSVRSRRARPLGTPSYSSATVIGSPTRTVTSTLPSRGRLAPTGWMSSVPSRPTGTTGQPAVRARCATPVRPR